MRFQEAYGDSYRREQLGYVSIWKDVGIVLFLSVACSLVSGIVPLIFFGVGALKHSDTAMVYFFLFQFAFGVSAALFLRIRATEDALHIVLYRFDQYILSKENRLEEQGSRPPEA